jgi:hypothetical protein
VEPLPPGEAMICPILGVAITSPGIIIPIIGITDTDIADARSGTSDVRHLR